MEKGKRRKKNLVATGSMSDGSIPPWEISEEKRIEWAQGKTLLAFKNAGYVKS